MYESYKVRQLTAVDTNSWERSRIYFWCPSAGFCCCGSFYSAVKLRNIHCFNVMANFSKIMRTIHTPPWLVHFSLNLSHLLNVKYWQYSHWNVLWIYIWTIYADSINVEKLARIFDQFVGSVFLEILKMLLWLNQS